MNLSYLLHSILEQINFSFSVLIYWFCPEIWVIFLLRPSNICLLWPVSHQFCSGLDSEQQLSGHCLSYCTWLENGYKADRLIYPWFWLSGVNSNYTYHNELMEPCCNYCVHPWFRKFSGQTETGFDKVVFLPFSVIVDSVWWASRSSSIPMYRMIPRQRGGTKET